MAIGTVKFFNSAKGYGFIAPDGASKDVFVHVSAVERSGLNGLNEGEKVSFDVENDHEIIAYTAGKMRKNRIRSIVGDRVHVEMTAYDLDKGRIVFREKTVNPPMNQRRFFRR